MSENRWYFLLNLVGGVAVLGGYVLALRPILVRTTAYGEPSPRVFGASTPVVCFQRRLDIWSPLPTGSGRLGRLCGFVRVRPSGHHASACRLVTAALWMPTWWAWTIKQSGCFWPIQGLLAVTGLTSLALPVTLRALNPPNNDFTWWLSWVWPVWSSVSGVGCTDLA